MSKADLRVDAAYQAGAASMLKLIDTVADALGRMRDADAERAATVPLAARAGDVVICDFCRIPLATGECKHIYEAPHDQVTMSRVAYEELCRELERYRRNG